MRLLWVVPRFGPEVVGGAETLVRRLATRALPDGWTSEIATTCAVDHSTWRNELPPGETEVEGLRVHRFPVDPRDELRHAETHAAVVAGRASYLDELEWLASGVWSRGLGAHLERADHDLVILCPYLFGTTLWGAMAAGPPVAVLPCLHDEPYARLVTVGRVLGAARGCIWNTPAEERLTRRLHRVRDGGVVGMGFDPPEQAAVGGFAERHGLGTYVLYAGRLEEGKRVQVAVEHAVRHRAEQANAPRLVLLGAGGYEPPREAGEAVLRLGHVSEDEKRSAMAGALALVNPSEMESLSIVLMEAWLEATPALVAAGSEVMRDHCEASGGGEAFGGYEQYRAAVERLVADPGLRERMGEAGRRYVVERYSWPAVSARFAEVAGRLAR